MGSGNQSRDAGMVPRPPITTVTYFIRTEARLYPAQGSYPRSCLPASWMMSRRWDKAAKFRALFHTRRTGYAADLQLSYDFIVCGSGSSGSVIARRLAETEQASVLLLEAGGSDEVPTVQDATQWSKNLGTERDWSFHATANPQLGGRLLPLSMGKVLGGGSSINAMIWSHGHRNDWDYFAAEANDPSWKYEAILRIYRRVEDWQGRPMYCVAEQGASLCWTGARS
jgi:choline dehydrogenase